MYRFRHRDAVLERLENHGRKETVSLASCTVDHIMPQGERLAGDPALAVDSIASDVRELPAEALAGTAARLWLSLPPDARKGTIILAPTRR